MIYILLIAGIILVIYGLIGLKNYDVPQKLKSNNLKTQSMSMEFENMLSSSIILGRLDAIENKLDELGSIAGRAQDNNIQGVIDKYSNTQLNIKYESIDDINKQIFKMKDYGNSVEEIADRLGIKKGEVLLRLGMRK